MQITSIFSGYSDPAKPGPRNEPVEASAPAAPAKGDPFAVSSPAAPAASAEAVREILAQYDVTDISPRSFSEMLQKLHRAGVLRDKDFQDLSSIRLEMERDGIDPDERVNLIQLYSRKLRDAQENLEDLRDKGGSLAGTDAVVAPLRRRLEWLQKVGAVHANPGSVGLDALA
jgi:hypothetical protein